MAIWDCDASFAVASRVESKPTAATLLRYLGVVVPESTTHPLSIEPKPVASVAIISDVVVPGWKFAMPPRRGSGVARHTATANLVPVAVVCACGCVSSFCKCDKQQKYNCEFHFVERHVVSYTATDELR